MVIRREKRTLAVEDADLSGSAFRDVNLSGSSFVDADLSKATFEEINLSGATFRDINFNGVEMSDCDVTGMRINSVPVADALAAFSKSRPQRDPPQAIDTGEEGAGVRPYQAGDEAEVIALWKSVFGYSAPHNDPATAIRQKRETDPDLLVVAAREGKVVGTAMGGYDGHRGWVYALAVDPGHRRQGIATALVRHVERVLKGRGCLKVNLQLLASNAETVAFYRKLGYAVEERISMGRLL